MIIEIKAMSYSYNVTAEFRSLPGDLCKFPGIYKTVGSIILRAIVTAFGVELAGHDKVLLSRWNV